MVEKLLGVYEYQSFADIGLSQNKQKRGCKVPSLVGKAHVLDVARILNEIWSRDEKYARTTYVVNFWKKYGLLKYSYFSFTESESDEDVLSDVSIKEEEDDGLNFYMDDLVQVLTNFKSMLFERKYEIRSISDENSFTSIGLPAYFELFSDGNLADMENNWSKIEENE